MGVLLHKIRHFSTTCILGAIHQSDYVPNCYSRFNTERGILKCLSNEASECSGVVEK